MSNDAQGGVDRRSFLAAGLGVAAAAGLGVGLLPVWLAEELPGLVRLPIQSPIPPAQIFAVLPGGRRPPRRVRALLDWLVLESAP